MKYPQLAPYIDHTLLKAEATPTQIRGLCEEARVYGFASVCVNPRFVRLAVDALSGSSIVVCSVIGFPLGAAHTRVKAMEAQLAVSEGARELDMVMAIGAAKAGEWSEVTADIVAVREAVRETDKTAGKNVLIKVIIECLLLTDAEKYAACRAAVSAGADFVKTSTGFIGGGATAEDVRLMRQIVGPDVGVKASGGIKTAEDATRMIEAGATRIGTSNSVAIITGDAPA
jgi:deoxyribose-phosphate aldolase